MFWTYLRRELINRRKQTIIISIGMALAIALVIVVNSVSAGVRDAQAGVLQSIYGVGTDITVAQEPASGQGGPTKFNFGGEAGQSKDGGARDLSSSSVHTAPGTGLIDSNALNSVKGVDHVSDATAVLSLMNIDFKGTVPDAGQAQTGEKHVFVGGADGSGGSSFGVTPNTLMGVDPAGKSAGPLSSTVVDSGRTLTAADAGKDVLVLDKNYATSNSKKVGDVISIAGKDFTVVGIVGPSDSSATTASDMYIPLDVAQTISNNAGKVTSIYVTADSASNIDQIKADIAKKLPGATVNTQADLASSVTGTLGSAGDLISNLGTWLSVIVLAAAFLIAILFTISGVTRRTREFGTLKAIGWSNRHVVGQVAGESIIQGLIGGVIGVALGLIGVLTINLIAPTLSAGAPSRNALAGGSGRTLSGGPGGAARPGGLGQNLSDVVLHVPVTVWVIVIAVALSILGGLLAGAIGGWRASRLRPAAALRSVA